MKYRTLLGAKQKTELFISTYLIYLNNILLYIHDKEVKAVTKINETFGNFSMQFVLSLGH